MFRQRQARPTALAITILATLAWSGNAKSEMEVCSPEFFELTRTVVTPHIQWAVPLAGGPVRVLVIAPRIYQRDTVELAQRLDLDYEYLMLYSAGPDAKPVFGRWDRGLGGNIEGITSQDVLEEFRLRRTAKRRTGSQDLRLKPNWYGCEWMNTAELKRHFWPGLEGCGGRAETSGKRTRWWRQLGENGGKEPLKY